MLEKWRVREEIGIENSDKVGQAHAFLSFFLQYRAARHNASVLLACLDTTVEKIM